MQVRYGGVIGCVGSLGVAAAGAWMVASGAAGLDVGMGRRERELGPLSVDMSAPREVVFDVVAEPYLGRTPRAMAAKLKVLERGSDMVLAAHYTPSRGGLVTRTIETVRFSRPERIDFFLVRGPVPHVRETFFLRETSSGTTLEYRGELGTDFWAAGLFWGRLVATKWEKTVAQSLEGVRTEAERRAADRRTR